jgi:hypothetical protein
VEQELRDQGRTLLGELVTRGGDAAGGGAKRTDHAVRVQIELVRAGRDQTVGSNDGGEAPDRVETRTKGEERCLSPGKNIKLTREGLR